MGSGDQNRCDYRLEIGLSDVDTAAERCNRPVWEDHRRCTWHAQVDGKTKEQSEKAAPESQDNLD
jgi:hypothetical protein